ncbi:hypothetical protein L484_015386 [Morus notabilis]|uniref:Uncharacterized protein n=1 Tax=Morus notabilis TaxID=981085 RepID=W9RNW9_9ROSA|nr:hypothetical protein L484_015386 [Morus notabilis]
MESIFRLLLHELNLVQGDHSDLKLLTSIDFHRRDLATILEMTKWQNRYGLALFLSGGSPSEPSGFNDARDNGILRRYLESTTATSAKEGTLRDAENRSNELETLNGNGVVPINHNFDYRKDNNFEKVGSYGSPRLGI